MFWEKNIRFWYSKEPPHCDGSFEHRIRLDEEVKLIKYNTSFDHWDGSFVYPQHMFWLSNKVIYI